MWNLNYGTNEPIYETRLTDIENRLVVAAKGEGERERMDWEFGIGRRKLLHLEWINKGFPGGAVVRNPPANAGDTGSSPGPGRSHMPRSN